MHESACTCARMARICTTSSMVYGWVRMMSSLSSRSTGMPCGDTISVPLTCKQAQHWMTVHRAARCRPGS